MRNLQFRDPSLPDPESHGPSTPQLPRPLKLSPAIAFPPGAGPGRSLRSSRELSHVTSLLSLKKPEKVHNIRTSGLSLQASQADQCPSQMTEVWNPVAGDHVQRLPESEVLNNPSCSSQKRRLEKPKDCTGSRQYYPP